MHSKLQRWTDLIAALLSRRMGATFDDLTADVPAYAASVRERGTATAKRNFERDKDELRDFGVRIETLPSDENDETRYRLRASDFYLPYLALPNDDTAPPRIARPEGYRALGTVALTPEDLSLLGAAIARLQQLGDAALTGHARSAANKLAFELPIYDTVTSDLTIVDAADDVDAKLFD
ncbi:MAG: hypothetical protein ACREOK_00360, partial [Gemmatimonadaceae bacterium]